RHVVVRGRLQRARDGHRSHNAGAGCRGGPASGRAGAAGGDAGVGGSPAPRARGRGGGRERDSAKGGRATRGDDVAPRPHGGVTDGTDSRAILRVVLRLRDGRETPAPILL